MYGGQIRGQKIPYIFCLGNILEKTNLHNLFSRRRNSPRSGFNLCGIVLTQFSFLSHFFLVFFVCFFLFALFAVSICYQYVLLYSSIKLTRVCYSIKTSFLFRNFASQTYIYNNTQENKMLYSYLWLKKSHFHDLMISQPVFSLPTIMGFLTRIGKNCEYLCHEYY